jgi:hypothetical protein
MDMSSTNAVAVIIHAVLPLSGTGVAVSDIAAVADRNAASAVTAALRPVKYLITYFPIIVIFNVLP